LAIETHDIFRFDGVDYRVTDAYPDSGFMMTRLNQEPNYYIDLVIKTEGQPAYDSVEMVWVTNQQSHNVTALLTSDYDYAAWASDSQDQLDLSVDQRHIGFRPEAGMEVVWDGRTRTIRRVQHYRGERQYKLRCS
jgi:hypothetical protein